MTAAGNVTNDGVHSYGYDSENRIVSVDGGSTASYAYDHQNRRYKKTIGSTVTHYVWQGSKVLAEHNGSTGAVLIDYVYSGSRLIAKVASGSTQYFLSDRLSTRLVLDSGGNVSGRQATLAFGEDFGESGTQEKHHFTSYERDGESGLDYAVNRQYSQNVGRFNRVDPVRGSMGNPQELNRYAYVQGDPVSRSDRLGLISSAVDCYFDWRGCEVCYNTNTGEVISRNCVSGAPGMPGGDGFTDTLGPVAIVTEPEPEIGDEGEIDRLLDLLKRFWDLNPCEKTVAMNTPFPFLDGVLEAEAIAQKVAKVFGDGDDDYGNAVKHCTWSCEMARRTNQRVAKEWGTAHECDSRGRKERGPSELMDLHNNAVGREIAKQPESEGSCAALCARSKDLEILKH